MSLERLEEELEAMERRVEHARGIFASEILTFVVRDLKVVVCSIMEH